MDGQVVVQVLHEEQFIGQDDVHGLRTVSFDVVHKLSDGYVELLHFACEVNACGQDLLRMVVHGRVVEIEPFEVMESSSGHTFRHWRLESLAKVLQVQFVGTEKSAFLFGRQEEVVLCLVLKGREGFTDK